MLGFSLVSFIEILYWLSGRLARNCMRKTNSEEGLTVAELGNVRKVREAPRSNFRCSNIIRPQGGGGGVETPCKTGCGSS